MTSNDIPELINAFNVYDINGKKQIGISGPVKMPDFEQITETISGPGIAGEIAVGAIGHFTSQQISIPFRTLVGIKDNIKPYTESGLTLRGAFQKKDSTGKTKIVPMRVVVKGSVNKFTTGEVKQAGVLDINLEYEIIYIKIELEDSPVVELDKLNFKYVVDGEDLLEEVRSNT